MSNATKLNGQFLEGAAAGLVLSLGASAPASMALTYTTAADTMGLLMHNAITAQHGVQTLSRAAVATVCAQIVATTMNAAAG